MTYVPTYLPDGRKAYNPQRMMRDIHEEWDKFTRQVIAEGETEQWKAEMRGRELWRQEEENGERWGEWQERVWKPRMAALAASRPSKELTKIEWEFLAEHFSGANDPIAQSILTKAMLNQSS